ncbi:MAG: Mov34/MPN/PAD-1 family protein [Chitinophagaceae bacterium]|nr:Mov34/MPN/PAD-1 family protein [Chitinophagaceae bacterium]
MVFISQELDDKKKSNFDQIYVNNYNKEQIILDPINGYKIFIPQNILEKIIKEIEKSDKKHNPAQETGGLIFGEWDDLTRSVYINEVSGPPADSKSSRNHFDCGVKGTKELNDKLKARYRGSIYFIGLWHSHPFGSATYSGEDKASMHLVVTKLSPPKSLLLIVAYDRDNYALGGFVFNKSQIN